MFRAVFDTNIAIAALKSRSPNSPSRELLQLLNLGSFYLGIRLLDGLHFLYTVRGDTPPGN
ncbi:MAG: PIN domain-containing protein [Anaerolineales bacterium]|nr:PIN domain-containing protein [Anaerolineales bacterium]